MPRQMPRYGTLLVLQGGRAGGGWAGWSSTARPARTALAGGASTAAARNAASAWRGPWRGHLPCPSPRAPAAQPSAPPRVVGRQYHALHAADAEAARHQDAVRRPDGGPAGGVLVRVARLRRLLGDGEARQGRGQIRAARARPAHAIASLRRSAAGWRRRRAGHAACPHTSDRGWGRGLWLCPAAAPPPRPPHLEVAGLHPLQRQLEVGGHARVLQRLYDRQVGVGEDGVLADQRNLDHLDQRVPPGGWGVGGGGGVEEGWVEEGWLRKTGLVAQLMAEVCGGGGVMGRGSGRMCAPGRAPAVPPSLLTCRRWSSSRC
jgi:hypothetical protein